MEDLRQYCLYKLSGDKGITTEKYMEEVHKSGKSAYFWYIIRAHELYRNRITEEASKKVMESLLINFDKVQECVAKTFN